MSIFIDPNQETAVTDEDGNSIWVKVKMDFSTEAAVSTEAARLSRGSDYIGTRPYELALLLHNVKRWEGPLFQNGSGPVPCDRVHICQFDTYHPLVRATLEKIDELNRLPTEPPAAPDTKKKAIEKSTSTG